jgi:hypothetical protein
MERFDHWLATITAIPVFGFILKRLFDKVTQKGAEHLEKKVGTIFGLEVEETGKGFDDEILFGEAKRHLQASEQQQVEDFRLWLRKKNKQKAEAFVLGVAKAVKAFEKQIKKTDPNGGGRKSNQSREKTERSFFEYDHSWSDNFFARLLTRTNDKDKEQFVFVEENFQSLVCPKKKPLSVIKIAKKAVEKTAQVIKKGTPKIKVDLEKSDRELDEDLNDILSRTRIWRDKKR